MKLIVILAVLAGLLLALFLWLRPVMGSIGTPTPPKVDGRASKPVPDGTLGPNVAQAPPGSTVGPAIPRPGPAQAAQSGVTHSDEIERAILDLVNVERAKVGAGPLQADNALQATARAHSDDMFVRGYFAHDDPDGLSVADRIGDGHRQLIGLTGENIWTGTNLDLSDQNKTATSIMNDWMHSSSHRDNILKKNFTHLGVGVAIKGQDVKATQNFAVVVALINQAVPSQLHSGESLNLNAQPVGSGLAPDRFEFFSSDEGMAVGGSRPIAGAAVPESKDLPSGIYKLRFIFPQGMSYWGPRVEVK